MSLPAKTRRKKRDEKIRRLSRGLRRATGGKLDSPAFGPLLRIYSQAIVISEAIYTEIREKGIVGDDGAIRPSVESFRRFAGEASRLASALGLSPVSLRLVSHAGNDMLAGLANGNVEDGEIVPANDTAAPPAEPEPVRASRLTDTCR